MPRDSRQSAVRLEWFAREVSDKIRLTMKQRVKVCTEIIHSRVVINISKPVTKSRGPRGGRVVTNRSKPGEFPKADTGLLLKSIFSQVVESPRGRIDGQVGSGLDYAFYLEFSKKLDRSYLRKTLEENREIIQQILMGPIH